MKITADGKGKYFYEISDKIITIDTSPSKCDDDIIKYAEF